MDAGMEARAMEQRLYVWDMRQQDSIWKYTQYRALCPKSPKSHGGRGAIS